MSTLGQKPATQHVSTEKQTITGNGGTSYTLQQSVSQASDIEVFVNNTRQEPTVAYTANNTTLTMTGAVNASDSFYVIFQGKAIQTAGLPVDAAITASTITTSQTITSTGNVTTSGTLNTPSINGGQIGGRRNMVINGAMQVAQRGTSFSGFSTSEYHLDRFRNGMGDTTARFTVTQASSGLNGFPHCLKYDCTTAEASLGNGNARMFLHTRFEGQDLQLLKKGTSDAEKVTVSFYVKSNKTGTYILELEDKDNTRQISKTYTINSANTWEQKIITFEGDTTGALDNDNARSFHITWHLIAGANYQSGTLNTSWASQTHANRAVGNVNIGDSTSNTWEITGIQMELGSQATEFEHRSFGEELGLCHRYFQRQFPPACNGVTNGSSSIARMTVVLQSTMRVAPSTTIVGNISVYSGTHATYFSSLGNSWTTPNQFQFDASTAATIQSAVGQGAVVFNDNSANTALETDDGLKFDAEL